MFERSTIVLKIACGIALALVLYRLGLALFHINPLFHVKIPALPELASTTATNAGNNTAASPGSSAKPGTNIVAHGADQGTNSSHATNLVSSSSNHLHQAVGGAAETNHLLSATDALSATNLLAQASNSIVPSSSPPGQNTNTPGSRTNRTSGSGPTQPPQLAQTPMPPGFPGTFPGGGPGMPPGGMPGMAKPPPALPPGIQTRVDRVVESEILAPVIRPLPMALLGIAGKDVFLRAPNGQTGLVKEGDELGGVKLVRIGINRVLVEEQGQQKELTIFAGLGGESLLSDQKKSPK